MKNELTKAQMVTINPFNETRKPVALLLKALEEEDQTIAHCNQAIEDITAEKENAIIRQKELLAATNAINSLKGIQSTNAKWADLAAAGAVAINGIDRILQAMNPDGSQWPTAIVGIRQVIFEYRQGRMEDQRDEKK